jgi:sec-independent protein translocase protein TatB
MIDIGIGKLLVVGVVALVVIGPEKLPATSKAIGILWARMQRYISKLKQEVNQHVNFEEIKQQAIEIEQQINSSIHSIEQEIKSDMHTHLHNLHTQPNFDEYKQFTRNYNGRNSWRLKQSNMPVWYKRKHYIKYRIQNGATRMKRYQYKARSHSQQHFLF